MKVSILMPVYNAGDYLYKSIESIQDQTEQDFEIIAMDDGSTDNSLDILSELAEADKRIRVYTRNEKGYAITMNQLLSLATGEFVLNVDPDDWIEPNMLERMLEEMDDDVDFVKCAFVYECLEGQLDYYYSDECVEFCPRMLNYDLKSNFFGSQVAIWTCLIRKSFIDEHRIRFNPTPGAAYQDTAFLFQVNACADKCRVIPDVLYHYNKLNDNASTASTREPFAPSVEYNFMADWCLNNPEHGMRVRDVLCRCRYGSYMWNMSRIKPSDRLEFAKLAQKDFMDDWVYWIDVRMFKPEQIDTILAAIKSPEEFVKICEGKK